LNCFRVISIPGAPGLHPAHELVQLAQKIDWNRFEAAFAGGYSPDMGAPAKATRLMVGLQYLKYTFNASDESVVDRWVAAQLLPDNPYDGHTLNDTLTAVQAVTGVAVTDAYVDKGYRGHGCTPAVNVHLPGQRSGAGSRAERRRRRRRSAVEPKTCPEPRRIGHLKPCPEPRRVLRRLAAALLRWLGFATSVLPDRRACCAAAADGDFFRDDEVIDNIATIVSGAASAKRELRAA